MNDDDRLSVAAYLESKGAWTTEIANQDTKEFGEYHLDVRYYTDTNEIIDLKAEREWNERAYLIIISFFKKFIFRVSKKQKGEEKNDGM